MIHRSAVLRAVGRHAQLEDAVFQMDLDGPDGLITSVEARSCIEAQDRTTYPPIRGSFLVTSALHITRVRLRFGESVLDERLEDIRVKTGYRFITDWMLIDDAISETDDRK